VNATDASAARLPGPAAGAATPCLVEAIRLELDEVDGLDLSLRAGEALHLHGPVEAGSAVLRALMGLERPRAGAARLLGEDPAALPRRRAAGLLARVGWLPRQGALLANLTLRENLLLPLEYHGLGDAPARAAAALAAFGLEAAPDLRPELVSLPVRRRVALARAVLLEPDLLLLDDPLDDLDEATSASLAAALAAWARRPGHALLVASPDHALAAALGAPRLPLPVTRP
jgi:predicted ABC-type transport system involved in lysophospholipase L1 biosynthesis ATPase subunit